METVQYFKPFSQGNAAFEKCFIIIFSILMIKKKVSLLDDHNFFLSGEKCGHFNYSFLNSAESTFPLQWCSILTLVRVMEQ